MAFNGQTDPRKRFQLQEKIGQGGYGYVCKAWDNVDNRVVAVKIINLEEAGEDVDAVNAEITVMSNVNCAQLTKYYASCVVDANLWIIMEYLEAGSLLEVIKDSGPLDEQSCCFVLGELLTALKYLHGERKIHRDIKAGNLLVAGDGSVKLADFGVTGQLTDSMDKRKTQVGTPFWMAPEVITQSSYDGCADIWSAGITAIELALGMPPYAKKVHPMQVIFLIPKSPPPVLEGDFSPEFKDFVACCLKKNPAERPSAADLLLHPFLKNSSGSKMPTVWGERINARVKAANEASGSGTGGDIAIAPSVPDAGDATLKTNVTLSKVAGGSGAGGEDEEAFGVDCSDEGWDFTLRSGAVPGGANMLNGNNLNQLEATNGPSHHAYPTHTAHLKSDGSVLSALSGNSLATNSTSGSGWGAATGRGLSVNPSAPASGGPGAKVSSPKSPQMYTTIDEKAMKGFTYEDTPPDANNAGAHYTSVVGMNFQPPQPGSGALSKSIRPKIAGRTSLSGRSSPSDGKHSLNHSPNSSLGGASTDRPPTGRPLSKEYGMTVSPANMTRESRSRSKSESSPLDFGLSVSSASSSYDCDDSGLNVGNSTAKRSAGLLNALTNTKSGDPTSPGYTDYWRTVQPAANGSRIVSGGHAMMSSSSNPMLAEAAALTSSLQSEVEVLQRKVDALEQRNKELEANSPSNPKTQSRLALDLKNVGDYSASVSSPSPPPSKPVTTQDIHLPGLDEQIAQFSRVAALAHSRAHMHVHGHCTAMLPPSAVTATAAATAAELGEGAVQEQSRTQQHPCAHSRLYAAAVAPMFTHLRNRINEEPSEHRKRALDDMISVLGTTLCALDIIDAPPSHFAASTTASALGAGQISPRAGYSAQASSSGARPPPGAYSAEFLALACAHMYEELEGNM